MSIDQRALAHTRDTFALKQQLDEALYVFAERLHGRKPTMDELDALVDECSRSLILPTAHYVKRTLRRCGAKMPPDVKRKR